MRKIYLLILVFVIAFAMISCETEGALDGLQGGEGSDKGKNRDLVGIWKSPSNIILSIEEKGGISKYAGDGNSFVGKIETANKENEITLQWNEVSAAGSGYRGLNIENKESYTFQIQDLDGKVLSLVAKNGDIAGIAGLYKKVDDATVVEPTKLTKPTGVKVETNGASSSSLIVSWTNVTTTAEKITGYRVSFIDSYGVITKYADVDYGANSILVTHLDADTTYNFVVQAVQTYYNTSEVGIGVSEASDIVSKKTPVKRAGVTGTLAYTRTYYTSSGSNIYTNGYRIEIEESQLADWADGAVAYWSTNKDNGFVKLGDMSLADRDPSIYTDMEWWTSTVYVPIKYGTLYFRVKAVNSDTGEESILSATELGPITNDRDN